MKQSTTLLRAVANGLAAVAIFLLPGSRATWNQALKTELNSIDDDNAAFTWAFGYLLAALKERGQIMLTINANVSRPVLISEMLFCFGPLTILWLLFFANIENGILANTVGTVNAFLNGSNVPTNHLLGLSILSFSGLLFGLLGPLGLISAYRIIVLRRPVLNAGIRKGLIIFPILLGISLIAANFILADGWEAGLFALLLFACGLPFVGALHLLHIGTQFELVKSEM